MLKQKPTQILSKNVLKGETIFTVYLMNHSFQTSVLFKGAAIQIQKALINDRLLVSKVS